MRNAETTLGIIRDRGRRGLPLNRIYRMLYNQDLYLYAYGRIYKNVGAMTPGATTETVDKMSINKIQTIIQIVKEERYRWKPVRRVYIPKKNSNKKRPLGLPTWSDKLVQEVMRLILEAYYEPQFSTHSHGFRPKRGCHTALSEIERKWPATKWFVEGDISKCFDSLNHKVLMSILRKKIQDNRFLRLIENLLRAGYLENWRYNTTLSGSPQGGIISPILTNIYLDNLDKFIETELIPQYNIGTIRKPNPPYVKLRNRKRKLVIRGEYKEANKLLKEMKQIPSYDPNDNGFLRLRYVRYADDFLLGFVGPKSEAEEIKRLIGKYVQNELKLELSETKTLITHAHTGKAKFLGYEIHTLHSNSKRARNGRRSINGKIGLRVPLQTIRDKCKPYRRNGKPIHRAERINDSVYSIMRQYQLEYRGIVEYYKLAYNLESLNRLRWTMEKSLTRTLSAKLRLSVKKVICKFRKTVMIDGKPRKILQVQLERENGKKPLTAYWGGISLAREKNAVLIDSPPVIWNGRTELVQRLLAESCEICGSQNDIEVHHIRALKDLERKGQKEKPRWVQIMAARQRKTLVVCHKCHNQIHAGKLTQKVAE
ncbi:reverse transcriptase domain-containing protein [Peribacillus asahii]|uniref:reverse transcriptase domain-containing protein n=1 Tax=Peribacillus asahii TaxID=228899 RepID=UPI003803E31C